MVAIKKKCSGAIYGTCSGLIHQTMSDKSDRYSLSLKERLFSEVINENCQIQNEEGRANFLAGQK